MRYSHLTMKLTMDKAIQSIRMGALIPRDERVNIADVLSEVRQWIAAHERANADKGRKTARDLNEVMASEMHRGR